MYLKHFSDDQLHNVTQTLCEKERAVTLEILWHLRENERRMLYAKRGYRDLKEYCVKELKYSEGSAWRRISAMKLLVDVPEVESKIQQGTLNLTQISMARVHFRDVKATPTEKRELLLSLENKSTRDTEKILAEIKPEATVPPAGVVEKNLRGGQLQVTLVLDEELQNQLDEIRVLLGKPFSKLELLKIMAREKLAHLKRQKRTAQPAPSEGGKEQKKDQKLKSVVAASSSVSKRPTSRYISRATVRSIKSRDQHRCQYKDPQSHRQCEAQFYLQIEHKVPFARGGGQELANLELLCPQHNRLRAVQRFGADSMKKYLPMLR